MTEKSIDMKIRFGPISLHRHNQYLSWSPNGNISYFFYEINSFQQQVLCICALIRHTRHVSIDYDYGFHFLYTLQTSPFWINAGSHKYLQK